MANSYFQFKQFTVHQEKCAMKVGTDGVLLGAWADLSRSTRLLDIGTGSGLIALMAAQRSESARIDAIEIDMEAYQQAQYNIQLSPWKERIHLFQGDIQNFTPEYLYDTIICNPPFFISSLQTPQKNRTIARHCTTLSHEDLFHSVQRLLSPMGVFYLILPVPEAEQFIHFVQTQNWFVNRITQVHPTLQKPPKRYLLQLSRQETPCTTDTLILEIERHQYHESFKKLVKDFYLHL